MKIESGYLTLKETELTAKKHPRRNWKIILKVVFKKTKTVYATGQLRITQLAFPGESAPP